jgi:hypothetical protein
VFDGGDSPMVADGDIRLSLQQHAEEREVRHWSIEAQWQKWRCSPRKGKGGGVWSNPTRDGGAPAPGSGRLTTTD